jgi:cation diffusion facilitator family transporter
LIAAGVIGFAGNEIVAIYRIRVGRRIGSAALMADGVHARLDGFTSLSVVVGAIFVLFGLPIADPIIGLLIAVSILVLLWGTVKQIGRRLMDGIEPELLHRAEHALRDVPGVVEVERVQLRWIGHRLHGNATVVANVGTLIEADQVAAEGSRRLRKALPKLDEMSITPRPAPPDATRPGSV